MGRRTEKPWGHEDLITLDDRYCFKLLFVKAGHRTSLQYHKVKHETMYFLSGKGVLEIHGEDGSVESRSLSPGDTFQLGPGTVHRLSAQEDVTCLEASTPEVDDVVRLEDDYGRA